MIAAFIGARSGSKGIPNKNIVDLGGKPLLAWSIETALQVKSISRVVVSSDSHEYLRIANDYGAEMVLRPEKYASDTSGDAEWIHHARVVLDIQDGLIVLLRPTTPLRDPKVIISAIASLKAHKEATSLRSVHEMSETAYKCVEFDPDGYLAGFMNDFNRPRQAYPKTYHPNGYVDILSVRHLVEYKTCYGYDILGFQTPRVTEVDTPEDLEYLRWQVKHGTDTSTGM
jgi:CMP-N-acetylneuraminic acid synthetase